MGALDEDLIARAEARAAARRPRLRRWMLSAACIALVLVVGIAATVAADALEGLRSYFGGDVEPYLEEILAAGTSVSNASMELRIDGAIADEHSCHMVVSFIALDEGTKARFSAGNLEEQALFDLFAVKKTGERVEFKTRESGTYVEKAGVGKKAKTLLADADMTFLLTGYLDEISMYEIETVCFAYEGLTLELPVGAHITPEVLLQAADPAAAVTELRLSRMGFYFTVPAEEAYYFDLKLIRADGTVWVEGFEDLGYSASWGSSDEDSETKVVGYWGGGSPVSVGLIDLDAFCGVEINGERYYYAEPGV